MKQEIAEQWVAALRSGEFKQGRYRLRNTKNEFCCLGVLCELYARAHPHIPNKQPNEYYGNNMLIPDQVERWAGMKTVFGLLPNNLTLSMLNDEGKSFNTIADLIDKHWQHL